MAIDRRTALKTLVGAGAAVAGLPSAAAAKRPNVPPEEMVGMLYDVTLCIGCKACVAACRDANDLHYEPGEKLWDDATDLDARTKNVIKLYEDGSRQAFMKMQCMHCVDPACMSACMMAALHKEEGGVVVWDGDKCVGCRYCQIACPFNVPKFEWEKALPKIVKCELCNHRPEGPACCEVCPREAVIYGRREELLAEAKRRIAADPDRYYPKVYGEHDAGGTQVLYLTAPDVPFEALGLPDLGDQPLPERVRGVQGLIYKGFIAPIALYAILGTVIYRNQRRGDDAGADPANTRTE